MLYLLLLFTLHLRCHGLDRITANESLSGDQTIVSPGSKFVMGFFSPGNSSSHYIGIWYNQIPLQTIVWVANREAPISNRFSSHLRISDGNLVLFNESGLPVWSTNLSRTTASVEAAVLDEGNLVLLNGSGSVDPLWQSFDHPAHVWLPGGRLGFNKITKRNTVLTSWKSKDDPAPGPFTVSLDLKGTDQYLIMYNSTEFWWSGPWDPVAHIFSLVPEMRALSSPQLANVYNYTFVDNEIESYAMYTLNSSTFVSRFGMDVGGQIQQQSWILGSSNEWTQYWNQPRVQCEVYGYCGPFGSCTQRSQPFCNCLKGFIPKSEADYRSNVFYGGCKRRTELECSRNSSGFLENRGMKLPSDHRTIRSENAEECRGACLNNCTCTAYSYGGTNRCLLWFGELLNLVQDVTDGDTIFIKVAPSELPTPSNGRSTVLIAAVAGSVAVLVIVAVASWLVLRRTRMVKPAVEGSLMAFTYREMQNATKNFSERLGGGGFGSVYKGVLTNSKSVVAVKKLEGVSQGEKQFRSEVSTIGTIQHVNLVRLIGFCSEGDHNKLLVYEHMPNGSLDTHLFHDHDDHNSSSSSSSKLLSWKTRYNIALGTARGLTYLHEKCRDCIIHCDIKPENILLDTYMSPKVADFGLAKLVGRNFSRVLTTMRGTRGYLAPEWISGMAVTSKVDVFSYGMVLFELVSGRRNLGKLGDGSLSFFPIEAMNVINENEDLLRVLDPMLDRNGDVEEIVRVCKIACWCIQDREEDRPTMSRVVQILEGNLEVGSPSIPKVLRLLVDDDEQVTLYSEYSA
ncbi:G-type lectin S-receptor-like serine/threonine-protein kinase At2g19130 [Linum perenne]